MESSRAHHHASRSPSMEPRGQINNLLDQINPNEEYMATESNEVPDDTTPAYAFNVTISTALLHASFYNGKFVS